MNQDKLQMFVERYLELSSELKYKKGKAGAFMQLGELLFQKKDYYTSTKHFYRAMKIAEETSDNTMKEDAKVSFGMANASMKWNEHIAGILKEIEENKVSIENAELDDEMKEHDQEAQDKDN